MTCAVTTAGSAISGKPLISLRGRASRPTARDVYAGRLADETGVSKQAILSQLQGALRAADRRSHRREQKEMAQKGIAADIRIPYTQGGDAALGAASASRQLVAALLQDPDEVPYVKARLSMDTILLPEMQQALQAIFRCAEEKQPVNLTSLQQRLDDKAFQQVALAQAQNHDQKLARQDIDMYLERLQNAKPISERVAGTSDDQFLNFFANVKKEKGVQDPPPENDG